MSNYFPTLDNPYAIMAQGAYPKGPAQFPKYKLDLDADTPTSVPFDFSKDVPYKKKTIPGGKYYSPNPSKTDHPDWPKNGVVYLQLEVVGKG